MSIEQNDSLPAASIPDNVPERGPSDSPQNGPQNGQQAHRRRRRRRKGGKAPAAAQTGGPAAEAPQPSEQGSGRQQQRSPDQRRKQKSPGGQGRPFQNSRGQRNGGQRNSPQQNGNGGNGQQRRKSKPRRQQVFVGPMDHSYRAANGNLADGPPSTIEYHNGSGQYHSGFRDETPVVEHAPAVIREDAPTRIFCFIEDLFFLAKIQETARKLGVKVGFVKADKDIVARLAATPEDARPSLIVFDLNNLNAKPLTLIPKLKTKLKRGTSVIGFLSHLQGDLKAKAIEAGCDMVMPRSAFSQNLPNLLRRHGLEEEMDVLEAQVF